MAVADSGAAWVGGGTAAGPARGRAVGIVSIRVAAGAAVFAFGWESIRRGGRGPCRGTRGLVGAAVGLAGEDSGNDGATAARILLVCGAAELCGDVVRRS